MSQDQQDLPAHIAELFAACEGLYLASVAEIEAGRSLPPGADSPSAIAFRVMMITIREGYRCPAWAAKRVTHDWARFEAFQCGNLGDAFGIPDRQHLRAKRTERLMAHVYGRVCHYRRMGMPLKDNAMGLGALSLVGDELGISGKQVERLVTQWRKLCKSTGQDPDELLSLADAESVIRESLGSSLRSNEHLG